MNKSVSICLGIALLAVTGTLFTQFVASDSGHRVVRTSRIELVDEDGNARVVMRAESTDVAITIFGNDTKRALRLSMGASGEHPSLEFFDERGRVRALVGFPELYVLPESDEDVVWAPGDPVIVFFDRSGMVETRMPGSVVGPWSDARPATAYIGRPLRADVVP